MQPELPWLLLSHTMGCAIYFKLFSIFLYLFIPIRLPNSIKTSLLKCSYPSSWVWLQSLGGPIHYTLGLVLTSFGGSEMCYCGGLDLNLTPPFLELLRLLCYIESDTRHELTCSVGLHQSGLACELPLILWRNLSVRWEVWFDSKGK